MRSSRILLSLTGAAAVLAVAAAHGGQARPPTTDPVVAEIRALRADMNERLGTAIRAQLLVARLSVQEQRTNSVVRHLQDIESKLRENESAKEQIAASMKIFGELPKRDDAQDNPAFAPFHAGMERIAKADTELKAQQTELMRQLAEEQARWTAINVGLEELEKTLTGRK